MLRGARCGVHSALRVTRCGVHSVLRVAGYEMRGENQTVPKSRIIAFNLLAVISDWPYIYFLQVSGNLIRFQIGLEIPPGCKPLRPKAANLNRETRNP